MTEYDRFFEMLDNLSPDFRPMGPGESEHGHRTI